MLRALILLLAVAASPAVAAPWLLLPETSVEVDVSWRGLDVPMRFRQIAGSVDFDERRPETARARITVAAGSVATGLPQTDRLAMSADFLDAGQYPDITFTLDRLVQTSRSTADIQGRITFRGVTRPIAFHARVLRYGPAEGAGGRFEAGFGIEGAIDRTEFGSTGALPEVPAVLPIHIRLMMASR